MDIKASLRRTAFVPSKLIKNCMTIREAVIVREADAHTDNIPNLDVKAKNLLHSVIYNTIAYGFFIKKTNYDLLTDFL